MKNSNLNEIYEKSTKNLLDTGKCIPNYSDQYGKYEEYTEGYALRDDVFKNRINETIESPYFKNVYLMVLSAILSSNNEEQFLDILDRYLSGFFSKKLLKQGEDLLEKKTYIRAYLNFFDDSYLKYKFLLEKWDWNRFDNFALSQEDTKSIYTIVEHVYEKVKKEILSNIS